MKTIVGERVGGAAYPIFVESKKTTWPIGFAVKVEKGWIGIRLSHCFARPSRAAVIESLVQAEKQTPMKQILAGRE